MLSAHRSAILTGEHDPHWDNVVYLGGFQGADASTTFVDESKYSHPCTAGGNAQIDTAQFKFGSSSALFDGTGDWIEMLDHDAFHIVEDFTCEAWVRHTAFSPTFGNSIMGHYTDSAQRSWAFCDLGSVSDQMALFWSGNGTGVNTITKTWVSSLDTWFHFAVDREGSTLRLYADGAMLVSSASAAGAFHNSTGKMRVGYQGEATARPMNGHLQEVRLTIGVARYANDAGFPVPTAPYPRG